MPLSVPSNSTSQAILLPSGLPGRGANCQLPTLHGPYHRISVSGLPGRKLRREAEAEGGCESRAEYMQRVQESFLAESQQFPTARVLDAIEPLAGIQLAIAEPLRSRSPA